MKIDRQKIGDLAENLLLESGWTEKRDIVISSAFQRRLRRRGYDFHENAQVVLRSFSGITLRRRYEVNNYPTTVILRFLSHEYFPRGLSNRRTAAKRADVTLLREIFNLHPCMIAQQYLCVADENKIDYSRPGRMLVYAMSDGSFCLCDFQWFYLWRVFTIEDVLQYMFGKKADPSENLLVLDSPEYGARVEELGLIDG